MPIVQPTSGIQLTAHVAPPRPEVETLPPPPPPNLLPPPIEARREVYPLDLATALRLADAENTQVNLAREQILQAYAEQRQANVLWLPSLRSGVHWNHHDGPLLSSSGNLVDVSRSSLYTGMGGQAVGGGSPVIPGLFASFHLADAIFQPLAAQQRAGARRSGAAAARNDVLLNVSVAYLELLRAAQDVAIAQDIYDKARELAQLTDAYARTGQGLQADADRMHVELALRENDIRRSREAVLVASARLAQLLRLQPCLTLLPLEPGVVPWCVVDPRCDCRELVAQALSNRPELLQARYLVGEAVERLRRERYAPLVPSVLLGASYGGFGGGRGDDINGFDDRFDLDATAFWELRNLGGGDAAARQNASSRIRQAQIQQLAVLDLVAREVAEAQAQVEIRAEQIETARAAVQAANESFEHNFVRIRQAQGLPIEVLQAIQALLQARREYLRTVIDYNVAQFTLRRAMGWPAQAPSPAASEIHIQTEISKASH